MWKFKNIIYVSDKIIYFLVDVCVPEVNAPFSSDADEFAINF